MFWRLKKTLKIIFTTSKSRCINVAQSCFNAASTSNTNVVLTLCRNYELYSRIICVWTLFSKLVILSFWAFCVFRLFCAEFDVSFINFLTLHIRWLHSKRYQFVCVFVLNYLKQLVKTDITSLKIEYYSS